MFKRTLLTVFVVVLAVSFTNAQNKNVVNGFSTAKKQLVVDAIVENSAPIMQLPSVTFPSNPSNTGEQLTFSTYDYFTNSVVREMVVFYKGVPHITAMERGVNSAVLTTRLQAYFTKDGSNWVKSYPWGTVAKGWGSLSVGTKAGSQTDGVLAMVSHVPNQLAIFDGSSWVASTFEDNTDPSIMIAGDDIFLGASNNRTFFKMWKTSDLGGTYTFIDSINSFAAKGGFAAETNGGVELGMTKSPDEKYLAYYGTMTGLGEVYSGVSRAQADNFFIVWTADNGATWEQKVLGHDGDTTLTNITKTERVDTVSYVSSAGDTLIKVFGSDFTFKYAPLFENFGHVDVTVANDGTVHAIANGYGLFVTSVVIPHPTKAGVVDTVTISATNSYFPYIYWNSKTNTWKEISASVFSNLPDAVSSDIRPGNGMGQAYGSLGMSADGQVLYATWMAAEFVGSAPEAANVTIDTSTGARYTDLHHVFSLDGGATWSAPAIYGSEPKAAESFPTVSQLLEIRNGSVIAPVVFLQDLQAGTSLFGEGANSNNPIKYIETNLGTVSVDPIAGPADFNLEQNYPNPFNPSTQISFSLPVSGNVTLKVFNSLGEEVATLINEVKSAGSYSVDFNASSLTSGVYFYSLQHNGVVSTKKMVLMK